MRYGLQIPIWIYATCIGLLGAGSLYLWHSADGQAFRRIEPSGQAIQEHLTQ